MHLVLEKDGKILDFFGIYFPNGGKSEIAWQEKLIFYKNFLIQINALRDAGHIVFWSGDINTAHTEIDLARPKQNDGKIGFHPLERAWLDACVEAGWYDIWRSRNVGVTDVYSWWDVKTRSRETNIGWRIDAIWGEERAKNITTDVNYLHSQMGSDHCPMEILIDF